VQEVQEELSNKTRAHIKLQEEVGPLRRALEQTFQQLTAIASREESMIDKRLISKLIVTYFDGKTNKAEVLELIAKMLNFTDDEKTQVGLSKQTGRWGFVPFFGSPSKNKQVQEKTLTDMWVDFLLKEASSTEAVQDHQNVTQREQQPIQQEIFSPSPSSPRHQVQSQSESSYQ